jgi:hypothetical protein
MKPAAASDTMLSSGSNHLTALDQTAETKTLISAFQPVQEDLQAAAAARVLAEKAMGAPRVVVRFTEKGLEKVIREIALLSHTTDNNATTGPAFKALFPNGLDAEVSPRGAAQIAAAVSLRERLDTQPAATKVKAQVMDKFDQAFMAFKLAIDARQAAETKLSQARAAESGARERFVKAYDSNMGAIRQLFPRDRVQQDLYFNEVSTRRSSPEAGEPPSAGRQLDSPQRVASERNVTRLPQRKCNYSASEQKGLHSRIPGALLQDVAILSRVSGAFEAAHLWVKSHLQLGGAGAILWRCDPVRPSATRQCVAMSSRMGLRAYASAAEAWGHVDVSVAPHRQSTPSPGCEEIGPNLHRAMGASGRPPQQQDQRCRAARHGSHRANAVDRE